MWNDFRLLPKRVESEFWVQADNADMQRPILEQGVEPHGILEPAKRSLYTCPFTHKNYLDKPARVQEPLLTLVGQPLPRYGKRVCLEDPRTHGRTIEFLPVLKDVDSGRPKYSLNPSEDDIQKALDTFPSPQITPDAQLTDTLPADDEKMDPPDSIAGSAAETVVIIEPVADAAIPTVGTDSSSAEAASAVAAHSAKKRTREPETQQIQRVTITPKVAACALPPPVQQAVKGGNLGQEHAHGIQHQQAFCRRQMPKLYSRNLQTQLMQQGSQADLH